MVVRLPNADAQQVSHLGALLLNRRRIFQIDADDMADRVSEALRCFDLDLLLPEQLHLPLRGEQLVEMEAETLPTPLPITIAALHVYDHGLDALERMIDELCGEHPTLPPTIATYVGASEAG